MSNSGANNFSSATMGVGVKHALEKGLHALFLRICVCVCLFSFYPEGSLEVCLCVFELLGCVFFALFCSTCFWRQLYKESSASSELVTCTFSWCLVCGLISVLMSHIINIVLPFVSVCFPLSVEDDHYWCNLCCGCCRRPHHHSHPDTLAGLLFCCHRQFIHHPLHPILRQLSRLKKKTDNPATWM